MTITAICIPFLFLFLIELGLRFAKYAEHQQDVFITDPNFSNKWVFNPFYTDRYFSNFSPGVAREPFNKTKPANGFRVFVLGGSTTAGFPFQFDGSFASRLKSHLRTLAPTKEVEVINLGVTAFSSFAVHDLSTKLKNYQPDAVLIYSGHNEFYGTLGSVSTFNVTGLSSPFSKRLFLRLWDFKLTWLIRNLFESESQVRRSGTLMANAIRNSSISKQNPLFRETAEQFASNIELTVETLQKSGIPVFVGTLVSNEGNQAPLGMDEKATALFDSAQITLRLGDSLRAKKLFNEAKEADPLRFRAPDTLNSILLEFAEQKKLNLVRIDSAFEAVSPSAILGRNLFTDHLHPNAKGYELMATTFANKLASHFSLFDKSSTMSPLFFENPLDASRAHLRIKLLLADTPFSRIASENERALRQKSIFEQHKKASFIDSLATTILDRNDLIESAYQQAISYYAAQRDTQAVLFSFRGWLVMSPLEEQKIVEAAVKYVGKNSNWLSHLQQVALSTHFFYDVALYPQLLSSIHLYYKNTELSSVYLKRASTLKPDEAITLFNYFRFYSLVGDSTKAKDYYEKYQNSLKKGGS